MKRDLALERAWRDRIRRYERSGLTVQQFCDREGLVTHQLTWWRRELKRRASETPPTNTKKAKPRNRKRAKQDQPTANFVPVHFTQQATTPSIEIILDQPVRIAVTSGFDANLLAEVVRVLESRSC